MFTAFRVGNSSYKALLKLESRLNWRITIQLKNLRTSITKPYFRNLHRSRLPPLAILSMDTMNIWIHASWNSSHLLIWRNTITLTNYALLPLRLMAFLCLKKANLSYVLLKNKNKKDLMNLWRNFWRAVRFHLSFTVKKSRGENSFLAQSGNISRNWKVEKLRICMLSSWILIINSLVLMLISLTWLH